MTREFPEEKFVASVLCTREDLAEHFATAMAKYFLEYRTKSSEIALDGCLLEIATEEFTDLLSLLPFYRASVSELDGIPAEEVDESQYLNSITMQIKYRNAYWAQRCHHELNHIVTLYGQSSGLGNPVLHKNTASVICHTWDALYAMDSVIMNAGYGYSTHKDSQKSCDPAALEVKSDVKPLVVFGTCMVAVVMLLICLL